MRIQNKWVLVTKENEIKFMHYVTNSYVQTNDTLNTFDTFPDLATHILDNSLDVSKYYRFEYEELLTEDELADENVITLLDTMQTPEGV